MLVFSQENLYYCRGSTAINYNIGRFEDLDRQITNKLNEIDVYSKSK